MQEHVSAENKDFNQNARDLKRIQERLSQMNERRVTVNTQTQSRATHAARQSEQREADRAAFVKNRNTEEQPRERQ